MCSVVKCNMILENHLYHSDPTTPSYILYEAGEIFVTFVNGIHCICAIHSDIQPISSEWSDFVQSQVALLLQSLIEDRIVRLCTTEKKLQNPIIIDFHAIYFFKVRLICSFVCNTYYLCVVLANIESLLAGHSF